MNKKSKPICPTLVKLVNSQLHRKTTVNSAGYLESGWSKLELKETQKEDGSYHVEILDLECVFVFDKKKNLLGAFNCKY